MRKHWIIALGVCAMVGVGSARATELGWLAGHWCGVNDGVFNEEVWLSPRGGMLVGMHRDTRAGNLAGFEFQRIVREQEGWVFRAQPGGAEAVSFQVTIITTDTVEFANPAHDFPRRIRYRLLDAETLQASIDDGTDHGPRMSWTWKRNCAPPAES